MFIFHEKCQSLGHVKMQNLPCNTPLFLVFLPHPEPLKTEKRKFAFSWEMKSVFGHLNGCLCARHQPKRDHQATSWYHQEYMRTREGNSILTGLSRQNSKFVIDDAQPLSFQVSMHSTLNTCMLRSPELGPKLHLFDWHFRVQTCTLHARVRQSTVFNVGFSARG